ncbi:MAG TPA: ribose-5-phosphate isomerase, partial [Corynebacterium sp.]
MRIYLGADHAGFEMKNLIKDHLEKAGHEVVDCGA